MTKKNRLRIIALMSSLMVLLTACGQKPQNNISEDMQQIEDEKTGTADKEGLNAMLAVDEETWVDSVSMGGKTIDINAKVILPDVENMKVVSLEKVKIDAEYKKNMLEKLFEQPYVLDELNPPQWYIDSHKEWIEEMKQLYLAGETEPEDEENYKYYISLLDTWRTRDTDTFKDKVSENYEEWSFYGEYGGNWYEIAFAPESISWTPADCTNMTHFKAASGKVCSGVVGHAEGISAAAEQTYLNMYENHCEMSLEEAEKVAKDFLDKLGYAELGAVMVNPLSWYDEKGDFSEPYVDGYSFTFYREIDGIVMNYDKASVDWLKHGDYDRELCMIEVCSLNVTDAGVIGGMIEKPFIQKEFLSEGTMMLSYRQVKDVLLSLLSKDESYYHFSDSSLKLNAVRLTYYLMEDNGTNVIVPVWRLENQNTVYNVYTQEDEVIEVSSVIMINAIDGSVIVPGDEENQ